MGDHLYTFSDGILYQVNKHNGQTVSRTRFGIDEKWTGDQSRQKIWFDGFAIMPDGRVFLMNRGIAAFDHDLWTTTLPYLKGSTKEI